MCDLSPEARLSVERQRKLFDRAKARDGQSIRYLATESGIPETTLRGWRDGAAMPAWGLCTLGRAGVADDLLSLVGEPFDMHVGRDSEGNAVIDELFEKTLELSQIIARARSDSSPGGSRIVHSERAEIEDKAREVVSIGKAVVRGGSKAA